MVACIVQRRFTVEYAEHDTATSSHASNDSTAFVQHVAEFREQRHALFKSKAALAGTEGLQAFVGDSYLATRSAQGWITEPTAPPRELRITVGGDTGGGPYAFSPDLGGWVLFGADQAQRVSGEGQIFSDGLASPFSPLSPLLVPKDDTGTKDLQFIAANFSSTGTSADLSATVFPTFLESTAYLPGDPRNPGGGQNINSYLAARDDAGQPSLELLARDKDGNVLGGRCGSRLGGGGLNQGAISADGSRIYFTTRPAQPFDEAKTEVPEENPACDTANPLRVLKRLQTPAGPEITELIGGGPSAGDDLYQGASLDGSQVFLVTPRKLSISDQDASGEPCESDIGTSKGCDLYVYDSALPAGERIVQVSAGGSGDPDPGVGADVLSSLTAISADGSHVYFVAQGVLTTDPNAEGAVAQVGQANLYLYERDPGDPTGRTAFIGTLAAEDEGQLWGVGRSFLGGAYAVPLTGAAEGGDGHILFLVSKAPLIASDTDGARADVFRYDSNDASLQCISCSVAAEQFDASAGPNNSAAPSSTFAIQGRWASDDGQTAAFSTAEPIAPGDADEAANPYLWKEGVLTKLPGEVGRPEQRPVVSVDGGMVGFTTSTPLLPQDGDTANDVYAARVNGGFPVPVTPAACNPLVEGQCQGGPAQPLANLGFGTATFIGAGNIKAPPKCKKGFVRKKGKCVKKPRKKAGRHGHRRKPADAKRGGKR